MSKASDTLSSRHIPALIAAAICAVAPLTYAIQYGIESRDIWAGAMLFGYFAIVACFIPVLRAVGKLLYAACLRELLILTERVQSGSTVSTDSRSLHPAITAIAGVTFTQAMAQLGRWFVLSGAPRTNFTGNEGALSSAVLIHVFATPVIESLLLSGLLEISRRKLSSRLLIPTCAMIFGVFHGVDELFWFLPAAILFAFCTAVYLIEASAGNRVRGVALISLTHIFNNAIGLALILGREFLGK